MVTQAQSFTNSSIQTIRSTGNSKECNMINSTLIPSCGLSQAALLVAKQKEDDQKRRTEEQHRKIDAAIEAACHAVEEEVKDAAYDERDSFSPFSELLEQECEKRGVTLPIKGAYRFNDVMQLGTATEHVYDAVDNIARFNRIGDSGMQKGVVWHDKQRQRLRDKLTDALAKVS